MTPLKTALSYAAAGGAIPSVGINRWPTKKAKQAHFSQILNDATIGEPLVEHYEDLMDLLLEHPSADQKIGVGITTFKVDLVQPFFTRGFHFTRVDGTSDDFSYRICLSGRPTPKQMAKRAFRNEIFPQIDAFRKLVFSNGKSVCALTGVEIENATAEIDHAPPNTFAKMVDDFLAHNGLCADEVLTASHDGGVTYCIINEDLRSSWQSYHAERAELRAVSPEAHKWAHANDNRRKARSAA